MQQIIFDFFVRRNDVLMKLIKTPSLDSVSANKMTEKGRDSFFVKLDSYTRLLVAMGVLPDEINGFADIDPSQLYNIDEVAIDTTKGAESEF